MVALLRCSVGRDGVSVATSLFMATRNTTEQRPSDDQHQGRGPAYVEGFSQLPFLGNIHYRVVEVSDDGVGNPAHGDEHHEACDDEQHSCGQHKVTFHRLVVPDAPGTLHAKDGRHESQEGEHGGGTHQSSGCLQVRRQSQQRIVDFALHSDVSMPHATHPQSFPEVFKDHNVASNEGRHSPLRHDRDSHCAHHAHTTEHQPGDLQGVGSHSPPGWVLSEQTPELVRLL